MSIIKPTMVAVIAFASAVAIPALAQQNAPTPTPTPSAPQVQQPPGDQTGEERGPRGRWGGPRYGEGRWERGSDDRMGPPGMMRDRMGERGQQGRRAGMMMRLCGPEGSGFADRLLQRIEQATKPTDQQKPAFDKLKEAANKASETIRAACPTERALTPTGRLAAAEKRLTAMLDAVKTVRPAMDAFYATLTDEQKARLNMPGQRMRRMGEEQEWRGRERGPAGQDRPRRWGDRGPDQEQEEHHFGDRTEYETPAADAPWIEHM